MLARLDPDRHLRRKGTSAVADADIVPSRYTGKVALVAGGGSGIGEAISRRLAAIGGSVTVLDLNQQNGRRVVGGARTDGRTASLQHGDVTDRGSLVCVRPRGGDRGSVLRALLLCLRALRSRTRA
jgi:NAD(P)-dependent dehydrogenase (short-subunit alcohol dehydrogenase family)